MGFFSKLFAGPYRPTPAERVPALAPLVAAMATDPRAVWPAFSASLRNAGQWDLRIDAVEAVFHLYLLKQPAKERSGIIDALVAHDPAAWTPVRVRWYLGGAYDARGSGTKIKDPKEFARHINAAQAEAVNVLNGDPHDPGACVAMLTIARLTGDEGLGDHMHEEGLRRAPDCFAVHRAKNDMLSDRWGGSHEEQLAHARHVAASAPNGSLLAGLPINALFFHLSHFVQFDNDHASMMAFAKRPDVLGELRQAAARSVDDPNHRVSASTFDLRTKAAIVGGAGMDVDLVRRQFVGLGDVFIDNPWRQLNPDPEPMFDMYRKMYGS